MDFITKNKTTLIGLVALAALVWGYFAFFGGSSSAPLTAVSSDSALSGNLLTTLNSLHTIKLDNSIFTDPVFLSLSDFGTTLPDQPSGRANPFAAIGANASASQPSTPGPSVTPKSTTSSKSTSSSSKVPPPPASSAPAIPAPPSTPTLPAAPSPAK